MKHVLVVLNSLAIVFLIVLTTMRTSATTPSPRRHTAAAPVASTMTIEVQQPGSAPVYWFYEDKKVVSCAHLLAALPNEPVLYDNSPNAPDIVAHDPPGAHQSVVVPSSGVWISCGGRK